MKKTKTTAYISLVLAVIILVSPISVSAADGKEPHVVKTVVDDDGTILSEYSNGSKRAVDGDGNVYVFEADGTEYAYYTDGSTLTEYSDGRIVSTEPNGDVTTSDGNGNYATTDKHGLTKTINADGTFKAYFEGGEGVLTFDNESQCYVGTTVSKDGLTIEADENNTCVMTVPDGSTITADENGGSLRMSDGSYMDYKRDGSVSMSFSDGSTVVLDEDGYGEMTMYDGSCLKTSPTVYDYYDAESGDTVYIDKETGSFEMNINDGEFHSTIENGVYTIKSTKTGDTLIVRADGSAEILDADGNVKKQDDPLTPSTGFVGFMPDDAYEYDVGLLQTESEFGTSDDAICQALRAALYSAGKCALNGDSFTVTVDNYAYANITIKNLRINGSIDFSTNSASGTMSFEYVTEEPSYYRFTYVEEKTINCTSIKTTGSISGKLRSTKLKDSGDWYTYLDDYTKSWTVTYTPVDEEVGPWEETGSKNDQTYSGITFTFF